MPQGQHSSIRVALAVPPKLHEQLKEWAEYEGRPIASLCMYLIENSLRQAQKDGIAPSYGNEAGGEERIGKWEGYRYETTARTAETTAPPEGEERKRFTQFYEDRIAERKTVEKTKKDVILAALQELMND